MEGRLEWRDVQQLPVSYFTDKVRRMENFTFSRWGDGEWKSLTGNRAGRNCDGHPYDPAMGEELAAVLSHCPPYYLGMQSLALRIYPHRVHPFLARHKLHGLAWIDADVFHKGIAGDADGWRDWLKALRSRDVIIVGPPHLYEPLKKILNYSAFIPVPARNCYTEVHQITSALYNKLVYASEPTVVCLSCSMPAEIIIDRLYRQLGDRHTLLDMGSVWDPYAGVQSRQYMRKLHAEGWTPPL